jgi:hypothetical protein
MSGKSSSYPMAGAKACHRMRTFPFVLLAALISVGCSRGPKLVSASGTVEYQGKPVPGANVVFVPDAEGQPATGTTDDQGRFTLTTSGSPGARLGSYKVTVRAVKAIRKISDEEFLHMTPEQANALHESLTPQKYANVITSGLTATVKDDPAANQFTFKLEGALDKKL